MIKVCAACGKEQKITNPKLIKLLKRHPDWLEKCGPCVYAEAVKNQRGNKV